MLTVRFTRWSAVTVALSTLLLAGCGGDSTAPDAPYDPAGTAADVAAIEESFDTPAVESYAAVATQISAVVGGSGSAAVGAVPSAAALRSGRGAAGYAGQLARAYGATGAGPSLSTGTIPPEQLGKTFVWDLETDQYVASDRIGAPADGVRFVLYAIDPAAGRPADPLNETGYADVVVTETSTSASVHLVVVSGGTTHLDYTVAVNSSASAFGIRLAGYATNGADRVNFDLDHQFTEAGEGMDAAINYVLQVPTRGGFRMTMRVNVTGLFTDTVTETLTLVARGEHGTVGITGSDTNESGTYTVKVNGDTFAIVTVHPDSEPSITGADGQPLGAEDMEALQAVFGSFWYGFGWFGVLVGPVS